MEIWNGLLRVPGRDPFKVASRDGKTWVETSEIVWTTDEYLAVAKSSPTRITRRLLDRGVRERGWSLDLPTYRVRRP